MIILSNISLPLDFDFSGLKKLAAARLRVPESDIFSAELHKKSVDARKKRDVRFNVSIKVSYRNEKAALSGKKALPFFEKKYVVPEISAPALRPVVVGCGPAGMFSALLLAKAGAAPIVLERGRDVDRRTADVSRFWNGGPLDERSNVQFGEGGAGTFSDGKLNTGIGDPLCRKVLEVFAEHGADPSILYDANPHIGTDVLRGVVKSMREEIIRLGGEVRFEHRLCGMDISGGRLRGVNVETPDGVEHIVCNRLILAIGHSARDTFRMLSDGGFSLVSKPFAIGVRIEHPRADIDRAQYGDFAGHPALSAAPYKLVCHPEGGRGVYTFCMCPGGVVVNASSERGRIAVNGMSMFARDGDLSNSALLVGVGPEDFGSSHPLAGMYFQENIEEAAFKAGRGLPLCQRVGDFLAGRPSEGFGSVTPSVLPAFTAGDVREVLPDFVTSSIACGITEFDRRLHGFANADAVLTAPETRSSSPVRILRGEGGMSSVYGVFPAGEGSGYAGGITSAAVDGLRAAERLIASL